MRKFGTVALSLVALTAFTTAADAKKPNCRVPRGGVALKHTSRVLVYNHDDRVIACLRPNGKRYYLADDDGIYNTVSIDSIKGATVTWTESYSPECKADCPPNVTGSTTTHTIDLRTGETT
jgi:hypothetical protein